MGNGDGGPLDRNRPTSRPSRSRSPRAARWSSRLAISKATKGLDRRTRSRCAGPDCPTGPGSPISARIDGHWVMAASRRRRHAAQAARPARADRRRLHGQLRDGPADRCAASTTRSASGRPPRCSTPSTTGGSQFRGDARVKDDKDVTDADIAAHNLVLWGDPQQQRPARQDRRQAADPVGQGRRAASANKTFDAGHHVPVSDLSQSPEPASATSCSTAASRSASTTT